MNAAAKDITPPADVTSYDLVKSFAVVIMVVDHMGLYFFPDDLWWRAVGRIGFPVWFFLAGHSSGRGIPWRLAAGAFILLAADRVVGRPVFPLNALFEMMLIRVSIDFLMEPIMKKRMSIWELAAFLFIFIIPSGFIVEYGTQGLITAVFGYLVKNRERLKDERLVVSFMAFALVSFVGMQKVFFGFTLLQMGFVFAGTLLVRLWLYHFKLETYPRLTRALPEAAAWPLRFMGRRTLEIYVVHLTVFKFALLLSGDAHLKWFGFSWF